MKKCLFYNIEAISLAKYLANIINKTHLVGQYNNERAIEKNVYRILKNSVSKKLHLKGDILDNTIITHGETKEEKKRWSKTKSWQDVITLGCRNTADIVIRLANKQTIAIQIKHAKGNITGCIQTITGQCLIAALQHNAVIGLVLSERKPKYKERDRFPELINMLKKHNIFLVIKTLI